MDIPTTLVFLVVLLMAGAYVAQPFIGADGGRSGGRRLSASALRQRADRLAERNRLYADLRDLDAAYRAGDILESDYREQRRMLVTQGVEILQSLDNLPDTGPDSRDPIEAAVRAARADQSSSKSS